ncbi:HAD family hydrolase [Peribacillus sp. SCS-155]|uniref:HAD family hydrolase n=1 Tax=Peribacillus sedimenti TaxID=3115297 RepID=UPI0039064C1D
MKVAIFDFDGTLFPEETYSFLMDHLRTHPEHSKRYFRFISRLMPIYIAYKCRLYPERKMKEYSMRTYISSFGSTPSEEIERFLFQLGDKMSGKLSEPVLARLKQHKEEGFYIMLVSGAFQPLLQSVAKDVPFDSIIGTSIDNSSPIDHINGERKREVVHAQLASEKVDWQNSFAYGDSFSDLDVLELVGNPVAVNPEPRLLQVANERKWEIIG